MLKDIIEDLSVKLINYKLTGVTLDINSNPDRIKNNFGVIETSQTVSTQYFNGGTDTFCYLYLHQKDLLELTNLVIDITNFLNNISPCEHGYRIVTQDEEQYFQGQLDNKYYVMRIYFKIMY